MPPTTVGLDVYEPGDDRQAGRVYATGRILRIIDAAIDNREINGPPVNVDSSEDVETDYLRSVPWCG